MKVSELRNRAATREKTSQPHNVSPEECKTIVVSSQAEHLRIVRTDALIQELLQRGQFRKALPTLNYGAFEVAPEFAETFQELAGECGLSVREAEL